MLNYFLIIIRPALHLKDLDVYFKVYFKVKLFETNGSQSLRRIVMFF